MSFENNINELLYLVNHDILLWLYKILLWLEKAALPTHECSLNFLSMFS